MFQGSKTVALLKKLTKSTSIYAGGNLLNRAIPFILLPVLTRFLTPEDYGILATFIAVFGVMQIFVSMGTVDAIVRSYFDIKKIEFDFSSYVFNGIVINVAVASLTMLIWILGKAFFEKAIPIPFGYQLLIPLLGVCMAVYSVPCKLWMFKKQPLPYTFFNLGNVSLEVALALILIVLLHFNWQGRVIGITISRLAFMLIGAYVLIRHEYIRPSINREHIKSILQFGFPVLLHSLGFVIIAAIDKFFLNKFIGLSTTGIYSVGYSICSMIGFLAGAFNAAWAPFFYEKLGSLSEAVKIRLVKYTYLYFAVVLLATGLFIKLVPLVLNIIVGEKFLGVGIFIFWLALGFGFHSMYTLIVSYIFYAKKTHVLSVIAFVTVILSFVSNYILIKINGAIGVAQATCLVYLVRFLLVWYFGNKVYPMPWMFFLGRMKGA